MLSKLTTAALAASFIALAGCAQTETSNGSGLAQDDQAPQAQSTAGTPADTRTAAAPAAADNAAQPAITNPAIIEFDARNAELDSQAQAYIARLAASAKHSRKIVITGYCDKHKAGNAKSIALSRAVKVKNELIKNGVAAKFIRVKYITDQAKNIAKVDLGSEPLRVDSTTSSSHKH